MNKIFILSFYLFCVSSCSIDSGRLYKTQATIYLINNTPKIILSEEDCNSDIYPGDTLVFQQSNHLEYSEKPSNNNYSPFPWGVCLFFYDKEKRICESGLRNIENYDNRKEISPLVFEFTFRFTEERKANAVPCN